MAVQMSGGGDRISYGPRAAAGAPLLLLLFRSCCCSALVLPLVVRAAGWRSHSPGALATPHRLLTPLRPPHCRLSSRPPTAGGHPDLDWLAAELAGPKPPKMVVITNPCNPTGALLY